MPQVLVADIDDDLLRRLEERAARHGHSPAAEHRAILEAALRGRYAAYAERAEQLLGELKGRTFSDSAEQIRADRDRDGIPP